jgi:hypothetical protein
MPIILWIGALNEIILQRFEAGLISRTEAIARLDRLSLEEAEEMAKKIEEQQTKVER